jgi:hypothetical protein
MRFRSAISLAVFTVGCHRATAPAQLVTPMTARLAAADSYHGFDAPKVSKPQYSRGSGEREMEDAEPKLVVRDATRSSTSFSGYK